MMPKSETIGRVAVGLLMMLIGQSSHSLAQSLGHISPFPGAERVCEAHGPGCSCSGCKAFFDRCGTPCPIECPPVCPSTVPFGPYYEGPGSPTPADTSGGERARESTELPESLRSDLSASTEGQNLSGPITSLSGGMGAVAQSISASPNAIGGYIDDAWIMTRVRVRYDNLQGANAPTRAEYLYSSLVTLALDGSAENSANEVDFEELSTYIEFAFSKQFSMFIDLPVRWVGGNNDFINQVGEQSGFGDIRAGFRYGWIACPDKALTLQFRIYSPTGDEFRGLGTGHPSFETGLLYSARTGDRKWFFAELQDWQSIDANLPTLPDESSSDSFLFNANANVLRYGLGCGYDIWQSCGCHRKQRRVTAVYEVVGWTVLHGYVTPIDYSQTTGLITADNISNASGDTIINGKYGLRYTGSSQSVYAGYGHNYTGDLWYSDLLRLEWQYAF